ncbi:hypothetical protein BJ878DRAFT_568309 [Calycina marina]|uniref:Uncharacterized protein n=1 Tax=Calycina marina TaxID=1763456 RepID=A0A9P8CED4_9HELO|nr:hypothetical protein BJ878DRAFT_568309 [Calycina marina]
MSNMARDDSLESYRETYIRWSRNFWYMVKRDPLAVGTFAGQISISALSTRKYVLEDIEVFKSTIVYSAAAIWVILMAVRCNYSAGQFNALCDILDAGDYGAQKLYAHYMNSYHADVWRRRGIGFVSPWLYVLAIGGYVYTLLLYAVCLVGSETQLELHSWISLVLSILVWLIWCLTWSYLRTFIFETGRRNTVMKVIRCPSYGSLEVHRISREVFDSLSQSGISFDAFRKERANPQGALKEKSQVELPRYEESSALLSQPSSRIHLAAEVERLKWKALAGYIIVLGSYGIVFVRFLTYLIPNLWSSAEGKVQWTWYNTSTSAVFAVLHIVLANAVLGVHEWQRGAMKEIWTQTRKIRAEVRSKMLKQPDVTLEDLLQSIPDTRPKHSPREQMKTPSPEVAFATSMFCQLWIAGCMLYMMFQAVELNARIEHDGSDLEDMFAYTVVPTGFVFVLMMVFIASRECRYMGENAAVAHGCCADTNGEAGCAKLECACKKFGVGCL